MLGNKVIKWPYNCDELTSLSIVCVKI
jgi:hypothetical protein